MKIEVKNLIKKYDDLLVLNNVNLDIYEHDFMIIYGKSGCGKTTLLQIIAGLNNPDKGEILYNGYPIADNLQFYLSNCISYVFQDHRLLNELNVKENIMMGLDFSLNDYDNKWYELLCDELDIRHIQDHQIKDISIGQRQRVAIARALIKKPSIIFLDEPTGSLDSRNTIYLLNFLKRIHDMSNLTIVMVTHETSLKKYGDRIIYINDREIKEETSNERYSTSTLENKKVTKSVTHYLNILNLVEKYTKKHMIYYLFLSLCIAICCISFFMSINVGNNFKQYIYKVASQQETSKEIQLTSAELSGKITIDELEEMKKLPYCKGVSYNLHSSYAFERTYEEEIIITYNNKSIADHNKMIDFFKMENSSTMIEGEIGVNGNEVIVDESIVKDLQINNPIGQHISIRLPIATHFEQVKISEDKTNSLANEKMYIPVNQNVVLDFVIKGVMRSDFEENYTIIHDMKYLENIVKEYAKKDLKENEITSYSTSSAYFLLDSVDYLQEALDYIENHYKNIECYSKVIELLECIDDINKVQSIYTIVNVFVFISLIGVVIVVNIINFSKKQNFLAILQFSGATQKEYKFFVLVESIYIFITVCIFSVLIIQVFLPILNIILSENNPIIKATKYVIERNMNLFSLDLGQIILSLAIGALLICGMQMISMVKLKKKAMIEILDWEVR